MNIVLNELEWARCAIMDRNLGRKPYETLVRVAKLYIYEGNNKASVRRNLEDFIARCEPGTPLPGWGDTIERAIKMASKYKPVQLDHVSVTQPEMDIISKLESKQLQRLAFTLLCISKYWDAVHPQNDHWIKNTDAEIFKMANINTSIKRRCQMYTQLVEHGLIAFPKKVDSVNIHVLFQKDGDSALDVDNFQNVGYQYQYYCGNSGFFRCAECGLVVHDSRTGSGRRQKYCRDCAITMKLKQNVDSKMRRQMLSIGA